MEKLLEYLDSRILQISLTLSQGSRVMLTPLKIRVSLLSEFGSQKNSGAFWLDIIM